MSIKSKSTQSKGFGPSFDRLMHSAEFLAVKYALEFITCGFIIVGVIRHY